ncbi:MAG: sodium-translocating pyrophosphatase [Candidatus Lokiarchaeota archaeon]|nr:sodium-translocating pyrophosphatase [Candidatus Lokiarchaeota archaeon]
MAFELLLNPDCFGIYLIFILITIAAAVGSIGFAFYLIKKIRKFPEGTEKMMEIAKAIRGGANTYLRTQYSTILKIGIPLSIILFIAIDLRGWIIGFPTFIFLAFLIGMVCSLASGWIAMYTATLSNVRTTNQVKEKGLKEGLETAFDGGMVMGLCVVGLSLLAVIVMYLFFSLITPNVSIAQAVAAGYADIAEFQAKNIEGSIIGLAFGASFAALFAQLGGGIYTKAADVGADLVGKVEAGIPEDDPRNAGVIADNVGDNVGDIAGRGADLFESATGENIATMVLAITIFMTVPAPYRVLAMLFPLVARSFGIFGAIIGKFFVKGKETDDPWKILSKGLYWTTAICAVFMAIVCGLMFPGPIFGFYFLCVLIGLGGSVLIGLITLYYTDQNYRPVMCISKASETGTATNIISGISFGLESTALPIIVIAISILGSYLIGYFAPIIVLGAAVPQELPFLSGIWGTALATIGMLSTCVMILALDGYGPITDNAGGIAEMADLDESVREKTDRLDACGNTTKALTKGYAIASAALAAFILFEAFLQIAGLSHLAVSIAFPYVTVGILLGGLLVFVFASFAMRAVGNASQDMIKEIRRQFAEIPGLREGKEGVKPDYNKCVDISTKSSLREMILPGSLCVVVPIVVGFVLGNQGLGGLLMGTTITGILMALFLNTGGAAFDNAKKLRKTMKDSSKPETIDAFNAAVCGDTLGDPMKDTAGPSIHVLIKLVGTISLQFAVIFAILPWLA